MTTFKAGDLVRIRTMPGQLFVCTRKGRIDADFEAVDEAVKIVTLRREYFPLVTPNKA